MDPKKKDSNPVHNEVTEERIPDTRRALKETGRDAPSVADFAHYRNLEFVGQGGMARVYRAYDSALDRPVALKFLREQDPDLAERLLFEARAQARIDHENVCKVYEVGEQDGKPFIAMQYIRGKTLTHTADELSIDEKVQLMRKVCEGVHAAHRAGVIHRDIKPGNILVERTEDGEWRPYVTDFGLAREIASAGHTVSGATLGTPSYMSPEQARGEVRQLDRRTDVYSLGVTFYHLLSGQLPYEANTSAEVFHMILSADPVSLIQRNTALPRDLNNVVMKCMEKDRNLRYESARALAEDLTRYLDGEPVSARSAGALYRIVKKIKRHKVITALLLSATLLVVASGSIALRARWREQEQAANAQRFGQEISRIESVMRYSHMLALHDTRKEKAIVRERMSQIQTEMKKLGSTAAGPGEFALGRGYMALQDDTQAQKHLETAWSLDYRSPELSYALGRVLGAVYQKELLSASRIPDPAERHRKILEIQHLYRDPAEQHLKLARGISIDSADYLEALIAFYDRDFEVALEKAKSAYEQVPWLYEALTLVGDIHYQIGLDHSVEGQASAAEAEFMQAEEAYEKSLKTGASDPQAYLGVCSAWGEIMLLERDQGMAVEETLQKSITACGQSLVADPDSLEAHLQEMVDYRIWADHFNQNGKDPTNAVKQAILHGEKVISADPQNVPAHRNLAMANLDLAEFQMDRGQPADECVQEAVDHAAKTVGLSPTCEFCFNVLGIAYRLQGSYEMRQGRDPSRSLQLSIDALQKALDLKPRFPYALFNLGNSRALLGQFLMTRGKDPRSLFSDALRDYDSVLQINPGTVLVRARKATVYRLLGEVDMHSGKDAVPYFQKGLEVCAEELPKPGGREDALLEQALINLDLAENGLQGGSDPMPFVQLVIANGKEIQTNNEDAIPASNACARAMQIAALHAIRQHWSVAPLLAESQAFVGLSRERNPGDGDAALIKARLDLLLFHAVADPSALEEAGRDAGTALRLQPESVDAFLALAEWDWLRGKTDDGLTAVSKAQSLNPISAETYALQSLLLEAKARSTNSNDLDQQAEDSMRRALALNSKIRERYPQWFNSPLIKRRGR